MFHVAALLFSIILAGADDLTLSGTVFDASGAPLPNARVLLLNTTDRTRWEATTAANGTYRVEKLVEGAYSVQVEKDGFFLLQTDIKLDASANLEFTLSPIETVHERVEVVARPEAISTDTVSSQETVSEAMIQKLPYVEDRNFINALALMPDVVKDNGGQIHIDGSRSDQIQYQLDGINITSPAGGLASNIPIDAIENIDIDVSGYSAEYGKSSGGMVHVQSQFIGEKWRWNLTNFIPGLNFRERTINEFSPRALLSGPVVRNKVWFMYSGALHYTKTFNLSLPSNQNRQNETLGDQFAKLQWSLAESHVLTFSALNNNEFYGNDGLSVLHPYETTTNLLRRGTTAAISNRNVVHNVLLETTLQWTHRRDTNLAKGAEEMIVSPSVWSGNYFTDRYGHDDRIHLAQTAAWETKTGSVVHRFKTGVEFDNVNSSLELIRRPFEVLNADNQLELAVAFAGPNSAQVTNREAGAFIQDRIVLSHATQVELGFRADRESITGKVNPAPRLAASYFPFESGHTKFSGGLGVFYDHVPVQDLQLANMQWRITTPFLPDGTPEPTVGATNVSVGPDLRNPYGVHWNMKWEQEWAPRWVSRINFIEKYGHDQIRLQSVPAPDGSYGLAFNNSGVSRYKALVLSLDRPIRDDFHIVGTYIYSQTLARPSLSMDFPDPTIDRVGLAPTDWNAPQRFISWGYFPFIWRTNAAYAIEARSGFPYSIVNELGQLQGTYASAHYPTYFTTNFSIEKEIPVLFKKRLALRIGVENLFNRLNPRFVDNDIDSPTFGQYSDPLGRNFVGRLRLLD